MEYRPMDITVISAEGIKNVNLFLMMDVYVVVSVTGDHKIKKKIHVDKNGGTTLRWSHSMKLTLPESAVAHHNLLFQIKSERLLGDKDNGVIFVPLRELLESSATANSDSGVEQIVDYQVLTMSGKSKGILKFSYKFGGKFTQQDKAKKRKVEEAETVTAYPAHMEYPPQKTGYANQTGPGGGYPPGLGYGGCPPAPGYGYAPQPMGFAYPPVQQPTRHSMDSRVGGGGGGKLGLGLGAGHLGGLLGGEMMGLGLGAGFLGGLLVGEMMELGLGLGDGILGGLLVGEMISNGREMAAYGAGYNAGLVME